MIGSDYVGGVFPVTFTAGSRMAMVFINTTSDETAEMSEEFKVVIQVPDDEDLVMPGDPDTAVVTITDDDDLLVFFDPDDYTVVEGDEVEVTVSTNRDFDFSFNVTVMTMPDTAVEGLDYEGGDYTAMFTPGSRTATVVIATIPDSMLEPNETFEALLMTTSEADDKGVEVGTPEMATITILDNTTVCVTFSPDNYSVREGETVNLTLVADKVFSVDFAVMVTLMGVTATGGEDYEDSSPYTVMFNAGSMTATLPITINTDNTVERSEEFRASLSVPESSRNIGVQACDPSIAMVTIQDTNGVVEVFFNPNSTTVVEGDRAKLTLFTDRDFSFNFTVDVMTMDITATDGSDYVGGVFPVTFTAGSRMAMVFINTTSDETAEMSEEFKVVIQVPDDEDLVMPGDPDTAVVTITDDDASPSLSL
jgi:hypothetical protein